MKHNSIFKGSALPGNKESVSGTIVNPNNFGMNKYISEDRKRAVAEYLKFVASKEIQKKYIIGSSLFSANMDLYEDEEVCSFIECDIILNSLPFSFINGLFTSKRYQEKYREYIFDYLYNNQLLPEVLKKIEDIIKIYKFSLKTDDSFTGLVIFFLFIVLFAGTALSLVFIFIKVLESRFNFLSKNLWVITTLGSLTLMSSILTLYGDVTNAKCHLRITLINVGFVLSICPSLLKLISNFPKYNKVSVWFEKNKYVALIIIMIYTLGINRLFSMLSFDSHDIEMIGERKYKKCTMESTIGNILYYVTLFFDFFLILASLVLIFMEWNLKDTSLDVRYLASALFMDSLSLILLIIIDIFKFKDYIVYNVLLAINILIFSVFNHIFIFLVRILPMFRPNSEFKEAREILGKSSASSESRRRGMPGATLHGKQPMGLYYYNSFSSNNNNNNNSINNNNNNNYNYNDCSSSVSTLVNDTKFNKIKQKIVNYHNQREIIF